MDNMPRWLAHFVSKAHPKIAEAAILDYEASEAWKRMDAAHTRAYDRYGGRVFKARLRGQVLPEYVTRAWDAHLRRHEAQLHRVARLWAHAEEEHDKASIEVHGALPPLRDTGGELLRFTCTQAGPCAWHRERGRPLRSWE